MQSYIQTINLFYLLRKDPNDDKVLSKYLDLIKLVDQLDLDRHLKGTPGSRRGPQVHAVHPADADQAAGRGGGAVQPDRLLQHPAAQPAQNIAGELRQVRAAVPRELRKPRLSRWLSCRSTSRATRRK